ncbi:MAG: hypothetical protein CVU65_17330 [Deltaproteobacteria bacterium HGW-Deltaproteobacteria-22]|jgi:Kef-type K+ transport system membrane component KefB/mannitol/fructose-specific phosphotransferase system IIA component (Ntr-type)|nr:MAG: hypothetical protein CVU65_17330 [Deltaproteobacteria bacterium HGW-Deltaproteobacteria-22]
MIPALALPITEPILLFGLVLLLVLIAPLISGRFNLPSIVGLILAGMIFGPHGLGVFTLEAEIRLLGQIGLVYIMFLAGVEIDLQQFFLVRRHSLTFGWLTFLIPLLAGALLAPQVLGIGILPAILLASMFSSHTLIPWPRISALGLTRQRAVVAIVGGTILTDTLALLLLVFLVGAHAGNLTPWFLTRLALSVTVFLVALFGLLPIVNRWFFRHFASDGQVEYLYVLCVVFLSAALAHQAGLEPILGAFFSGLILNRQVPEKSTLMNRIHFIGFALFIPFFLLSVGMVVDVRHFFTGVETLKTTAFMIVVALASKWLAARLAGRIIGWSREEIRVAFGLSVNQAAATLAAVMVGVNTGIFGLEIVAGTIGMIMVTCIVGSLVTERAARSLAAQNVRRSPDRPGQGRILVPLGDRADQLLNLALLLRPSQSRDPLYLLHVIEEGPDLESRVERGERLLEHSVLQATAADIHAMPLTRVTMHVGSGILGTMRDYGIETVVAGLPVDRTPVLYTCSPTVDFLVRNSRTTLLFARVPDGFSKPTRMHWVIPFTLEDHPGFATGVEQMLRLVRQENIPLRVSLPAGDRISLEKRLGGISVQFQAPEPGMRLPLDPAADEWTIFFMVRPSGYGWRPQFERIQKAAVSDFQTPLGLLFLPEPEEAPPIQRNGVSPADYGGVPVSFQLSITDFSDDQLDPAIDHLLAEADLEDEDDQVEDMFLDSCRTAPVILAPGIAFLHAHVDSLAENHVLMGRHPVGFDTFRTLDPVRVVVILLGQQHRSAQEHLTLLAVLARTLSRKEIAARLLGDSGHVQLEEELSQVMYEELSRLAQRRG